MTTPLPHIPTLRTERLTLHAPRMEDHDALSAFYGSPRASFAGGPMTPGLSWRVLAQEAGQWMLRGFGRWVATERGDDTPMGTVGLCHPDGSPENELGSDLFEGATGKGDATEAGMAARAYAYGTLGWTTLISLIARGNDASAAVARRLGATPKGPFTHGRFGTMTIWRHPSAQGVAP
ncbi:MAG: GNAT family N-acetyltransferase [Pseudomonadota bacterium]